jgi:hypothetical protein
MAIASLKSVSYEGSSGLALYHLLACLKSSIGESRLAQPFQH